MAQVRETVDAAAQSRLGALTGVVDGLVPGLVEQLIAAHPGRVYREALAILEKPLLVHALRLTGGSQLRAARLLGVNRNTLRKRCRELGLATSRVTARVAQ